MVSLDLQLNYLREKEPCLKMFFRLSSHIKKRATQDGLARGYVVFFALFA